MGKLGVFGTGGQNWQTTDTSPTISDQQANSNRSYSDSLYITQNIPSDIISPAKAYTEGQSLSAKKRGNLKEDNNTITIPEQQLLATPKDNNSTNTTEMNILEATCNEINKRNNKAVEELQNAYKTLHDITSVEKQTDEHNSIDDLCTSLQTAHEFFEEYHNSYKAYEASNFSLSHAEQVKQKLELAEYAIAYVAKNLDVESKLRQQTDQTNNRNNNPLSHKPFIRQVVSSQVSDDLNTAIGSLQHLGIHQRNILSSSTNHPNTVQTLEKAPIILSQMSPEERRLVERQRELERPTHINIDPSKSEQIPTLDIQPIAEQYRWGDETEPGIYMQHKRNKDIKIFIPYKTSRLDISGAYEEVRKIEHKESYDAFKHVINKSVKSFKSVGNWDIIGRIELPPPNIVNITEKYKWGDKTEPGIYIQHKRNKDIKIFIPYKTSRLDISGAYEEVRKIEHKESYDAFKSVSRKSVKSVGNWDIIDRV
jgi:hypothetical protein